MATTYTDMAGMAMRRLCQEIGREGRPRIDTPEGQAMLDMLAQTSSAESAYERERSKVSRLQHALSKRGVEWGEIERITVGNAK